MPWLTYPATAILQERVAPEFTVFEYGAGSSTLWWADRVAAVHAVEHDRAWHDELQTCLPGNARVVWADHTTEEYWNAAAASGRKFQVIVIDGRNRVACAQRAVEALAPDGVIIWDNSERPYYEPGLEHLRSYGLKQLDLVGPGPVYAEFWTTSILYRANNCLGI